MKKLFLKNWRDTIRHKPQFIALIVIVALGITSFIASIGAYENLFFSYNHAYEKLRFADFTVEIEAAPKDVVGKIRRLKEVKSVEGRLVRDTGLYVTKDNQARARLIGVPSNRLLEVNSIDIEEGSYFSKNSTDTVLLEKHFADYYKKKPGQYVQPIIMGRQQKMRIAGIVSSPEYLIATPSKQDILPSARRFAVIFLPQEKLEKLFSIENQINEVSILVKKDSDRASVVKKVEEILRPYGVIETITKEEQPSNAALKLDLEGYREIAYLMPALILIIAAFSLYIAMARLVRSQRQEIGLMKALGYRNSHVLIHYLIFSIIIALIGSTIGVVIGQWTSGAITRMYASELGIPFVKTMIYPHHITLSVIMSLLFCLAGGIVPAYQSLKLQPATAIRADPSLGTLKGRISPLERLVGSLIRLPFAVKIPLRNISRTRRRSLYTALGIIFAFILTISSWSMFDSIDYTFEFQGEYVDHWDIIAVFDNPKEMKLYRKIEKWSAVKSAQYSLQIPVKLKTKKKVETILVAMEPSSNFHRFKIIEGKSTKEALNAGGLILNPYIARKLGVGIGDPVTIETPWLAQAVPLEAISEEALGSAAYVSYSKGQEFTMMPQDMFNTLYLRTAPQKAITLKRRLYNQPDVQLVEIKKQLISDWQKFMGLFYIFMDVLLLFTFTMAFAVVFNTLTTNVLERERELATMRTIGENRSRMALMITLENLLLGILAVPFGLILGKLTANEMMKTFESEMFSMRAVMYPQSYLIVVGLVFVVLLLSEIPAIRRVFRLNLAESTKILE